MEVIAGALEDKREDKYEPLTIKMPKVTKSCYRRPETLRANSEAPSS